MLCKAQPMLPSTTAYISPESAMTTLSRVPYISHTGLWIPTVDGFTQQTNYKYFTSKFACASLVSNNASIHLIQASKGSSKSHSNHGKCSHVAGVILLFVVVGCWCCFAGFRAKNKPLDQDPSGKLKQQNIKMTKSAAIRY